MAKFEFSYDGENDDLFLFRKDAKSRGSVEFGNLVLDLDSKKRLVGLQIMDATDFISEMTGMDKEVINDMLVDLERCECESRPYRNMLVFKIFLFSKHEKKAQIPITLPSIATSSPATAMLKVYPDSRSLSFLI